MKPSDLDNEMTALFDRLTKKTLGTSDPYSSDPLSSDHFILSRSWDFFKKRIAAIERQWQEIVNSKHEEIVILKKELEISRDRIHELEGAHSSLEGMLAHFKLSRLQDFEEFKKKNERLQLSWTEERVTLESTLMRLEHELEKEKKKAELTGSQHQTKIDDLKNSIESLKKENEDLLSQHLASQAEAQKIILEKDEYISSGEAKVDLLRREVDRRDQVLRELEESLKENETKSQVLAMAHATLTESAQVKDEDRENLRSQVEALRAQKTELLDMWNREKAEWRELWERAREMWAKKLS